MSNHGGNNLDGTPASVRALPAVVDAVGDQVDVVMDGGVRRGSDVVKALALGARAVMIGRAYLWGLAAERPGGRRERARHPAQRHRLRPARHRPRLGRASSTRDDLLVPDGFVRRLGVTGEAGTGAGVPAQTPAAV